MTSLFDPGLQPERTLLAWRRTSLSLAVGSAVMVRLTAGSVMAVAAALGVAGLVLALATWVSATRRYQRVQQPLLSAGVLVGDGLPFATAAGSVVVLGIAAAAFVGRAALG